jgi:hypothetical protein
VQAGVGAGEPVFLTGRVYLTGPYRGAPYGLALILPALAGPFDLGTVVIRQRLRIDPADAHVTVVSDPFPTVLDVTGADGRTDGFPIRLRRVDVMLDRPGFTVNPTSCSPMAVTGTLGSASGSSAPVSSRFQVGGCRELAFKPRLSLSTSAHTSMAMGASLTAKVLFPPAASGSEANVASLKLTLPRQLATRLRTLQNACLASVFASNPAACPPRSVVGRAKVITPLLPTALTGPVYFVSHGGAQFPSLTLVLQGDGVTLDLVGSTFISKAGTTSITFTKMPDVPFESFAVTFPEGEYSALGANANLCRSKLLMPTLFGAQNGLQIRRSVPIGVTGCRRAKTRAQKLTSALKACRRKLNHRTRAACQRQAHRRYGYRKSVRSKRSIA